jgi:hypothetical protein
MRNVANSASAWEPLSVNAFFIDANVAYPPYPPYPYLSCSYPLSFPIFLPSIFKLGHNRLLLPPQWWFGPLFGRWTLQRAVQPKRSSCRLLLVDRFCVCEIEICEKRSLGPNGLTPLIFEGCFACSMCDTHAKYSQMVMQCTCIRIRSQVGLFLLRKKGSSYCDTRWTCSPFTWLLKFWFCLL